MTARERAKAASDKFKADFVGSVADKYYMGYLAGWREAVEAAAKVVEGCCVEFGDPEEMIRRLAEGDE